MKTTRRSRTGFTLIELLVVIAIIAILAALLFTGIDESQRESVSNQLHQQSQADGAWHSHVCRRLQRLFTRTQLECAMGSSAAGFMDAAGGTVPDVTVAPYANNPQLAYQEGWIGNISRT
jgi:prepilin-type N-terminal cleavage/methylation domain-containing protein